MTPVSSSDGYCLADLCCSAVIMGVGWKEKGEGGGGWGGGATNDGGPQNQK